MPSWEQDYRRRCEPYVGDASRWPAQAPSKADGYHLRVQFSHCSWMVSLGDSASVSATLYVPRPPTNLPLPFEPSVRPKWQIARCAGGAAGSETETPDLAVSDLLKVPDGYLVGYNSGEFGGGLARFDSQGQLLDWITSALVLRIVPTGRGAMAFTGPLDWSSSSGHAFRLTYDGKRWRVERVGFPGAPLALLPDRDGSFVVVTTSHLVEIKRNLRVLILHRGAWGKGAVCPSSVVRDASGTFYLGMSYAVARLRPTATRYSEEWLAPTGP